MSTLWRRNFFIRWSMTSKVNQGHIWPFLWQNHSSIFVYRPILMKICININIMKTKYMARNVTFMLWRCFVIFLNLISSDLITTLTYVLMDNCCPCFNIVCLAANVANPAMSTMKLESNEFLNFSWLYKFTGIIQ